MRVSRLGSRTRSLLLTSGLILVSFSSAMDMALTEHDATTADLEQNAGPVTTARLEAVNHEGQESQEPCATPG